MPVKLRFPLVVLSVAIIALAPALIISGCANSAPSRNPPAAALPVAPAVAPSVAPASSTIAAAEVRWTAYIAAKRAAWSAGKWGEIVGPWRALDAYIVRVDRVRAQYQSQLARVPQIVTDVAAAGDYLLLLIDDYMLHHP